MKKFVLFLALCVIVVSGVDELEGFEEELIEFEKPIKKESVIVSDWSEVVPPTKEEQKDFSPLWDEDEFEGFDLTATKTEKTTTTRPGPSPRQKRSIFQKQESYRWEILGLILFLFYLVNIYWGKIQNEAIAVSWAKTFVSEGSLIEKNFAMVGGVDPDEPEILMKESSAEFKFYASGRRYCQGMLITLNLRSRQDLLSLLLHLLSPRPDTIEIEVYMNEVDMGPMVCLLAHPKLTKALIRDNQDIDIYAREIPVKHISQWPHDRVSVWTELPDLFYDLMVPEVKEVFLSDEFREVYGKYFRFLYITSDSSKGTRKKIISFSFNLPSEDKMHELEKLMSLIPLFIDLVAEYEPTTDAKKRAEKNRAMESERIWREGAEERKQAFQQKKAAEQQAELERVKKMSPEEQQKWKEKQEKIKQKRAMKVKTLRV